MTGPANPLQILQRALSLRQAEAFTRQSRALEPPVAITHEIPVALTNRRLPKRHPQQALPHPMEGYPDGSAP
jgi:hypothetical protein